MLINLHSHLEGRVRPATAAEIAAEIGLEPPPGLDWSSALELTGPADLTAYLSKISATYPFFARLDHLARITQEAVEDAAADGLDYLELRFGPAIHTGLGIGLDDVIRAACDGLRAGIARTGMPAGLVVAALRLHDQELNAAVAAAATRFAGEGVVGFDLAGDELRFPALDPYVDAFAIAASAGLGLTCHAAEAAPAAVAQQAVELFGVSRIGHGAHVVEDPAVMRWIADRGIVIEVCPTSNWFTGAIADLAEHPVRRFVDAGIRVVLGDDNPIQTRSPLSREQLLLVERYDFTPAELADLDSHSVAAAFTTGCSLSRP